MHWGSKECASVVITGIIIRQGEVDNNELGKCDRCLCVECAWKWVPSLHLLFIYCFLLWLFVCDLSCPIRECFPQILRSRAGWRILLLCVVAFEQWRFVFMVHVQYLLWQDFRLQGQIHRPEIFTPHSEQLEKQLLQVMICYNTMLNLGLFVRCL